MSLAEEHRRLAHLAELGAQLFIGDVLHALFQLCCFLARGLDQLREAQAFSSCCLLGGFLLFPARAHLVGETALLLFSDLGFFRSILLALALGGDLGLALGLEPVLLLLVCLFAPLLDLGALDVFGVAAARGALALSELLGHERGEIHGRWCPDVG
jgi:hypothetical protein